MTRAQGSGGTPKWAVPAAIVVGLVLAAAVLGLLLRSGDDASEPKERAAKTATATPEPRGTIDFAQGRAIQLDWRVQKVLRRLGVPAKTPKGLPERQADGRECIYYLIRDQPSTYQFCFDEKGLLASAATVFPPKQNRSDG